MPAWGLELTNINYVVKHFCILGLFAFLVVRVPRALIGQSTSLSVFREGEWKVKQESRPGSADAQRSFRRGDELVRPWQPSVNDQRWDVLIKLCISAAVDWLNINMLNILMNENVRSHMCTFCTYAHSLKHTLKYHLINGKTLLMRTHLHIIIITLLHFSNQLPN